MNLVILGAPGSGKGTQSKFIVSDFGFYQFSTGDALRQAVKSGTDLGRAANEFIVKGQLVPDDVIFGLVAAKLNELSNTNGIIFDGFPRSLDQCVNLDNVLAKRQSQVDLVIYLKVDENLLVQRIVGRRVNPVSGKEYHITYNPPKVPGICDVDGSALIHRADDTEEKVKTRLSVFHSYTLPVLNYYKNKCVEVDASKPITEVYQSVKSSIAEKLGVQK